MEFVRSNFLIQNETPRYENHEGYPEVYRQEIYQQEYPSYLPILYEYGADRSDSSVGGEWEWGEWENNVVVKEEVDGAGASSSFSEEGKLN